LSVKGIFDMITEKDSDSKTAYDLAFEADLTYEKNVLAPKAGGRIDVSEGIEAAIAPRRPGEIMVLNFDKPEGAQGDDECMYYAPLHHIIKHMIISLDPTRMIDEMQKETLDAELYETWSKKREDYQKDETFRHIPTSFLWKTPFNFHPGQASLKRFHGFHNDDVQYIRSKGGFV